MNIILKKDGKLSVNDSPIQGKAADLDNLAAFISNPSDGDAIVYDADAGIWKAGASGGGGSSGGGDVFVLHIDYDESDDKYTIRETLADIGTAATAGKTFVAADDLNFCILYASIAMMPNVGVVVINISDNVRVDSGMLVCDRYEVNVETMEVTVSSDAYELTPAT